MNIANPSILLLKQTLRTKKRAAFPEKNDLVQFGSPWWTKFELFVLIRR